MAVLSVETINESGLALTLVSVAAESGDKWTNNGNQQVLIKNGSGSSVTVTITTQVTSFESPQFGNATKANVTLAVAAGKTAILGPYNVNAYNDANGQCNISYSATTSIEVGVFEIQKN